MTRILILILSGLILSALSGCPSLGKDETGAKKIIRRRCTGCHSTRRIFKKDRTRVEWEKIIDRMVRHGAELKPGEKQKIVNLLAGQG